MAAKVLQRWEELVRDQRDPLLFGGETMGEG